MDYSSANTTPSSQSDSRRANARRVILDINRPVEQRRRAVLYLAHCPIIDDADVFASALWDPDPTGLVAQRSAAALETLFEIEPEQVATALRSAYLDRSDQPIPIQAASLLDRAADRQQPACPEKRERSKPHDVYTTGVVGLWVLAAAVFVSLLSPNILASITPAKTQPAIPTPTPQPTTISPPFLPDSRRSQVDGITRKAQLHTYTIQRDQVIEYVAGEQDTLLTIADRFGLQPETILQANLDLLADDPHQVQTGKTLYIPPTDGIYYRWRENDTPDLVAAFFNTSSQDLVKENGQPLQRERSPRTGDWVQIIGGNRALTYHGLPRLSRLRPGDAHLLGSGGCEQFSGTVIGTGQFYWPFPAQQIRPYLYAPVINHWGVDIAGERAEQVYASDHGMVVYAGDGGLENGLMLMIDHGNGWLTAYTRLGSLQVSCGEAVASGQKIAILPNVESPFLHFEIISVEYGPVDPLQFLTH